MNKPKKPRNFRKFNGLHKKYHYKYNQDFIDQDYYRKLSEEERLWLATFNDNYYGGRYIPDNEQNVIQDVETKRELWNNQRKRRNDVYSFKENKCIDYIYPISKEVIRELDEESILQQLKKLKASDKEYAELCALLNERARKE